MAANLTEIYNVTNVGELFTEFNLATNDVLLGVIMFVQFMLIFMIFKNWDTVTVWIVNCFVSTLIASLFVFGLGWGDTVYVVVPFVGLAISIIVGSIKKN